jgi:hypothetical protein
MYRIIDAPTVPGQWTAHHNATGALHRAATNDKG